MTGGVPHSYDTNGAESIAAIEKVAGPEGILTHPFPQQTTKDTRLLELQ